MTYKLGCLPGKIPVGLRDLTYYAAGDLPQAPASVPVPAVAAWGMDGNDVYGDCGVAGGNHGFMACSAIAGKNEAFPGTEQIVSYYLAYTGGQDGGVVLSDYLAYVRAKQFFGHEVLLYAPVSPSDVPTLLFTVWAYGFAYTGIQVTQAMMSACPENGAWQPWTLEMAQGEPAGGHCIPLVGYDDQYLYAVTWGQVQKISYPAWHAMSQEAWAVITGEFSGGDDRGVSFAALQADLDQLGK
jgi:hypothetical protein